MPIISLSHCRSTDGATAVKPTEAARLQQPRTRTLISHVRCARISIASIHNSYRQQIFGDFAGPNFILHRIPWKLSMEIIPWNFRGKFSTEFHVEKHMKTPWISIVFHGNSTYIVSMEFSCFCPRKFPWKIFHGV